MEKTVKIIEDNISTALDDQSGDDDIVESDLTSAKNTASEVISSD